MGLVEKASSEQSLAAVGVSQAYIQGRSLQAENGKCKGPEMKVWPV